MTGVDMRITETDGAAGVADPKEALRQSIEEDKAELLDAVDELKSAVEHKFQLRERIGENPVPWLVGALLLGLWVGSWRHS